MIRTIDSTAPRHTGTSRPKGVLTGILGCSVVLLLGTTFVVEAQNPLVVPGENTTQTNMAEVIITACPNGTNEAAFQQRCDNLVGAALSGTPGSSNTVLDAMTQVSPGQTVGQGTQSTRTSVATQFAAIGSRLSMLRGGAQGFSIAGIGPGGSNALATLYPYGQSGGTAGADAVAPAGRLGGFLTGNYNFGDIDSTFEQLGFDFDSGGFTMGLDYRLTDQMILGGAFSYGHLESDFVENRGSLDADSYTGSVYGTFYPIQNLYIDGIASYGGIDYESIRSISYTVPAETVTTQARGEPSGRQFSFSGGVGYNFVAGATTVNPYVRANLIDLDIDSFSEEGGIGWGMRFDDQDVTSVTSTIGVQISHAFSVPFGVLLPFLRGEWRHEFEDRSRTISVRFLGDTTSGLSFSTVTDGADPNYYGIGTGVSGQFAQGISAFLAYDTLLGYSNVEAHSFTLGARLEF